MSTHGTVQRVDTDHVLIIWDAEGPSPVDFSKVGFQDGDGKTFALGDRVTLHPAPPGPDHWWTIPKILIDPKPSSKK